MSTFCCPSRCDCFQVWLESGVYNRFGQRPLWLWCLVWGQQLWAAKVHFRSFNGALCRLCVKFNKCTSHVGGNFRLSVQKYWWWMMPGELNCDSKFIKWNAWGINLVGWEETFETLNTYHSSLYEINYHVKANENMCIYHNNYFYLDKNIDNSYSTLILAFIQANKLENNWQLTQTLQFDSCSQSQITKCAIN